MTPRMCLPTWACTAWRPKSAARAQSLSTGCRPTMPSASTRSQLRSNRIRAPAARSLMPGTVYRSTAKPPPSFRSSSIAADAISYRDDVRSDLVEDVVDVALVAQDRAVDRLEGLDHLEASCLRHDRLVLEFPSGAVPRDDDPEFVAEGSGLAEEIHMTGMEEIEDPRRHYTDHERHARTMSCPSRNTRFLARAYAFASCFESARPSSAIISQMVAVGASPAMTMRAVVSSV